MTAFDDLLIAVEGNNWYQKRLMYFMVAPIFFFTPFTFLHQVFLLHLPDHWCTPPDLIAPDSLNLTLDAWKEIFLPEVIGPDKQPRPSPCSIYSVDNQSLPLFLSGEMPGNRTDLPQDTCLDLHGYTYDKSDLDNTVATDNDWTCDLQRRSFDIFTLTSVALVIGTAFFSSLSDYKGRKVAFYTSLTMIIVFMNVQPFFSHNYLVFCIMQILAFGPMIPMFQIQMNMIMEISTVKTRSMVIGWACITWAVGNCVLPFLAMWLRSWWILRIVCSVPLVLVYLCIPILPESPRWLVSKGNVKEARRILIRIATVNKVPIPQDIDQSLAQTAEDCLSEKQSSYGYLALFSSKQMIIRTFGVSMSFVASAFVYYQLVINIGNMGGNLFTNMVFLAIVEGPGCFAGTYCANRFGRRWSMVCFLLLNGIMFFIAMWLVYDPSLTIVVTILCVCVKMSVSGCFVVSYMQAMEVFPTCVRQSGLGFATLFSQAVSIAGPNVIYLGATDLKLPYLIMSLICLVGALSTSLLPETVGARLPETFEEANAFGRGDGFFSYLPKREQEQEQEREQEQEQESLADWNVILKDVGRPGKDVDASLIKGLLIEHYKGLTETKI